MKPRKVVAGVVFTAATASAAAAIGFGTAEVLHATHSVSRAEIGRVALKCLQQQNSTESVATVGRSVLHTKQVGGTGCKALDDILRLQKDYKNQNTGIAWGAGTIFGGLIWFGGVRLDRLGKENKQQKIIISGLFVDNNAMSQIITDNEQAQTGIPYDQGADEGRITLEDLDGLSSDLHKAMVELDLFPPEKKATS